MRYAVIADVHGNYFALETVLRDAAAHRVDRYLFAGDYCISNASPDECLTRIRNLPGCTAIRGNDDQHLERLIGQDPAGWTDGQMRATYWCHRNIDPENLAWLFGLPHQVALSYSGVPIRMVHSCTSLYEDCKYDDWGSVYLANRYQGQTLTHEQLLQDVRDMLNADPDFQTRFAALPDGVYVFGHTHVQWHYASANGRKVLINPGACGLPLDGIPGTVPYSILEITEDGRISLEERRIPVPNDLQIDVLMGSDLAKHAPVWVRLIRDEFRTGLEKVSFFLRFAVEYAQRIGDDQRPFSIATWEAAYRAWVEESARRS